VATVPAWRISRAIRLEASGWRARMIAAIL
jgi:nucleotide-binding universal stress UspA family protein